MRAVSEGEAHGPGLRIFQQSEWLNRFPDLVQGITGRSDAVEFGTNDTVPAAKQRTPPPESTADGWGRLMRVTGVQRIARCRQVHGARVLTWMGGPPGVHVLGEADALVTREAGALITVTVADCVPVYLVDPEGGRLGLAHAGWRGTAAGIVGATIERLGRLGTAPTDLWAHLGPAICGECYEVGPEVAAALGQPEGTRQVDLRQHLSRELQALGVRAERLSASTACSRCDGDRFFSYRGGDRGRRMCAYLGWRSR